MDKVLGSDNISNGDSKSKESAVKKPFDSPTQVKEMKDITNTKIVSINTSPPPDGGTTGHNMPSQPVAATIENQEGSSAAVPDDTDALQQSKTDDADEDQITADVDRNNSEPPDCVPPIRAAGKPPSGSKKSKSLMCQRAQSQALELEDEKV